MSNRILFKCDFGGKDGWGHVIRCSALAEEFQRRGWETFLWGNGDYDSLPSDVAIGYSSVSDRGVEPATMLFIDEMYTKQSVLEGIVRDWLSRNPGGVVAGIDDMQRRSMSGFDLVLNAEVGLEDARYQAGRSLLGERFALIRSGFSKGMMDTGLSIAENEVSIFVMLGGTDAFGHLPRILGALASFEGAEFVPVVVAGESMAMEESLKSFQKSRLVNRASAAELAALMAKCRLGVIACGSSIFEAAAMQLPFVGLSVVDNQTATGRQVERHWGQQVCFCEDGNLSISELSEKVRGLLGSRHRVYSNVDTNGAQRVCDELLELVAAR